MDAPVPSRRRTRDAAPYNARNVRPRCPIQDLAASRRRRRESAATVALAVRGSAGSCRNVRPRLFPPCVSSLGRAAPTMPANFLTYVPLPYIYIYIIPVVLIFRRPFLPLCICNYGSRQ